MPVSTSSQTKEGGAGTVISRLKRPVLILAGLGLVLVVLFQTSLLFLPRPVTLFGKPKVFFISVAAEQLLPLLDQGEFEFVEKIDDRDVGIFVVADWAHLKDLGVDHLCGANCASAQMLIVRSHEHRGLFGFRKDVFVNAAFFAEVDLEAQTLRYTDRQLACLVDTMRLDILRANNGDDFLPPCLSLALTGKDYQTVSSTWFSLGL